MRHTRSFLVALSSIVPLIATAGSSTAQEAKPSTTLALALSATTTRPSDRARRLATHSKSVRPKRWLMP
jgi:hypothetical protein